MKRSLLRDILMGAGGLILFLLPLFVDAPFEGTDEAAKEVILVVAPDYRPWAEPVFEPATPQGESLLFGLQAVFGLCVIGYYFARTRRAHPARNGRDGRA